MKAIRTWHVIQCPQVALHPMLRLPLRVSLLRLHVVVVQRLPVAERLPVAVLLQVVALDVAERRPLAVLLAADVVLLRLVVHLRRNSRNTSLIAELGTRKRPQFFFKKTFEVCGVLTSES